MSNETQDLVDFVHDAIAAHDWVNSVAAMPIIDKTPEKSWKVDQITNQTVLHINGGGAEFEVVDRTAELLPSPEVSITAIRYMGADDATGETDMSLLSEVEAVHKQAVLVARDAIKASSNFAVLSASKPVRYDQALMQKHIFISAVIFEVFDNRRQ